jgi:uncharacterized protein YcbX
MNNNLSYFVAAIGAVSGSILLWRYLSRRRTHQIPKPLTITELVLYPVKGLQGMSVNEWKIGQRGFLHDRCYMIVSESLGNDTTAQYKCITQRQIPRMCLLGSTVDLETGIVTMYKTKEEAEKYVVEYNGGMEQTLSRVTVELWGQVYETLDMGDDVAQWLSAALDKSVRLVRAPVNFEREPDKMFYKKLMDAVTTDGTLPKPSTKVNFPDWFPYLIITENSLADVNKRVTNKVDTRRFRPNIVIGYNNSLKAFDEEVWNRIQIVPKNTEVSSETTEPAIVEPSIEMYNGHVCLRCQVPNIDPDTAQREEQGPSYHLQQYHEGTSLKKPVFGILTLVTEQSLDKTVRVGDTVKVISKHSKRVQFEGE